MLAIYFAHAGEEHSESTEALSHQISKEPLAGILLATALVLIVAAVLILVFSRSNRQDSETNKKEGRNEPSDS